MKDFSAPPGRTPPPVKAPKAVTDRRILRDRRLRQLEFTHADRRQQQRRQTELQAYLWHQQISS